MRYVLKRRFKDGTHKEYELPIDYGDEFVTGTPSTRLDRFLIVNIYGREYVQNPGTFFVYKIDVQELNTFRREIMELNSFMLYHTYCKEKSHRLFKHNLTLEQKLTHECLQIRQHAANSLKD